MSVVVAGLLALGVAAAWLGVAAFLRLATPLERLHVVAFVNVATGGPLTLAAIAAEGVTARTLKCVLIWLTTLLFGALLTHVTGRALFIRDGERR